MTNRPDRQGDGSQRNWLRYSSLGIEMAVIVGVAVWGGVKIDSKRQGSFPLFTLLLSAAGLAVSMIYLVKKLDKWQ